jgi:hypothetical protein
MSTTAPPMRRVRADQPTLIDGPELEELEESDELDELEDAAPPCGLLFRWCFGFFLWRRALATLPSGSTPGFEAKYLASPAHVKVRFAVE